MTNERRKGKALLSLYVLLLLCVVLGAGTVWAMKMAPPLGLVMATAVAIVWLFASALGAAIWSQHLLKAICIALSSGGLLVAGFMLGVELWFGGDFALLIEGMGKGASG